MQSKDHIDNLTGFEFEDLITLLLTKMGLQVHETTRASDGGVDVIAISEEIITGGKYIIQCKRLASNVGEPIIRDLFGALHHNQASKAILITNSDFTNNAKKFAEDKPIELIDGEKLALLLKKFGLLENGMNEGEVVRFSPNTIRLVQGFKALGTKINQHLEKCRLTSPPRRRRVSFQRFNSYAADSIGDTSAIVVNITNLINDIGNQDLFSLEASYVDSRLELLRETVDSLIALHLNTLSFKLKNQYETYQSSIAAMIASVLIQIADYSKKMSIIEELHNTVVTEDFNINLIFNLNLESESQRIDQAISKLKF
jgi:hypothetical protein